MVKIVIDGHPSIDVAFYIKKLINENICINHTVASDIIYADYHPSNYLEICYCCRNQLNSELDSQLYIHNCCPYSYNEIHSPEDFSQLQNSSHSVGSKQLVVWEPDIIVYLYTPDYPQWTQEEKDINFKLEIMYDDMVCKHQVYKINAKDEPQTIFACICDILSKI